MTETTIGDEVWSRVESPQRGFFHTIQKAMRLWCGRCDERRGVGRYREPKKIMFEKLTGPTKVSMEVLVTIVSKFVYFTYLGDKINLLI